jgi:hypothetical protein
MTPETEGSSVTRPEIGAGFAGIFELLEAPDYRLAQHGPHTPYHFTKAGWQLGNNIWNAALTALGAAL